MTDKERLAIRKLAADISDRAIRLRDSYEEECMLGKMEGIEKREWETLITDLDDLSQVLYTI